MLQHRPNPPALRAADNFETTDNNIVWVTVSKAEEWSFVFVLLGSNPYTPIPGARTAIFARAAIPEDVGKDRMNDAV